MKTEMQLIDDIRVMTTGNTNDAVRVMKEWRRYFREHAEEPDQRIPDYPSLDVILAEVSVRTGVPVELMKSKNRSREYADARFMYFKRARMLTNMSFQCIGRLVNKDHASVMHGVAQVDECPELKELYEELFEGRVKTVIENKAILIGHSPVKSASEVKFEPIQRRISKYEHIPSANNQPYHGCRVHSL